LCLLAAMVAALGVSQVQLLARPLRLSVVEAKQLGRWAIPLAFLLTGFSLFAMLARWRRSATLCILSLAAFPPLLVQLNVGVLEVVFEAKSGRRIAGDLSAIPRTTELACLECFPNGLPFYLSRTATLISRDGHELTSNYIITCLEKAPQWPQQIVPLAHLDGWLASRRAPVWLIVRPEDRERVKTLVAARDVTLQSLSSGFLVAQLPARGGP
jgi:hypothetical protein